MVKGGVSKSEGHEFKSQRLIFDKHFFKLICCKICIVCLKKTENKQKEAEDGPFLGIRLPRLGDEYKQE